MHLFNHRHISSRSHQDSFMSRIGSDPYVDWLIMLTMSAVVACAFGAIGYLSYRGVQGRLSQPTVSTGSGRSAAFDAEALSQVLKGFSERSAERSGILQGSGIPGDPSF